MPVLKYKDPHTGLWVKLAGGGGGGGGTGPAGPAGPPGPQGPPGPGLEIDGTVPSAPTGLPPTGNTPGDAWISEDTDHLWVWDGTKWVDCGPIVGPPGVDGVDGVGIPVGGTTGQVLLKATDVDYETAWGDQTGGGGGIGEAPIDTKQYARQDASWTEVVPGALPDTGVVPGDYDLAFFEVDSKGRIITASSGVPGTDFVAPGGSGADLTGVVHTVGDEIVDGLKTFTVAPVIDAMDGLLKATGGVLSPAVPGIDYAVPGAPGVPTVARNTFTDADLTLGVLTVTHNLGQKYVQVSVYDDTDNQFIPSAVKLVDLNTLEVDLSNNDPLVGTWNVVVAS